MRTLIPKIIFLLFCLFFSTSALSGLVLLNNGDRITGVIDQKEGEILKIKTSYAGELSIKWAEVKSITSDSQMKVVLVNGEIIDGAEKLYDTSSGEIKEDQVVVKSVDIKRVQAINPFEEPKFVWTGMVNFGADIDRGNTNEDDYQLDANSTLRWLDRRFVFKFDGDIEETDGSKTKQEANFNLDYDHFITEKWYVTGGAFLEHDRFEDLDLRTTVGMGLGYQFIENKRTHLNARGLLGWVFEDFDEDRNNDFPTFVWNFEFEHYLFKTWQLQVFHNHIFRQSLESGNEFIYVSKTGLRIPLTDSFYSTFQFNYDWDNEPSEGQEEEDRETLVTVGYKW